MSSPKLFINFFKKMLPNDAQLLIELIDIINESVEYEMKSLSFNQRALLNELYRVDPYSKMNFIEMINPTFDLEYLKNVVNIVLSKYLHAMEMKGVKVIKYSEKKTAIDETAKAAAAKAVQDAEAEKVAAAKAAQEAEKRAAEEAEKRAAEEAEKRAEEEAEKRAAEEAEKRAAEAAISAAIAKEAAAVAKAKAARLAAAKVAAAKAAQEAEKRAAEEAEKRAAEEAEKRAAEAAIAAAIAKEAAAIAKAKAARLAAAKEVKTAAIEEQRAEVSALGEPNRSAQAAAVLAGDVTAIQLKNLREQVITYGELNYPLDDLYESEKMISDIIVNDPENIEGIKIDITRKFMNYMKNQLEGLRRKMLGIMIDINKKLDESRSEKQKEFSKGLIRKVQVELSKRYTPPDLWNVAVDVTYNRVPSERAFQQKYNEFLERFINFNISKNKFYRIFYPTKVIGQYKWSVSEEIKSKIIERGNNYVSLTFKGRKTDNNIKYNDVEFFQTGGDNYRFNFEFVIEFFGEGKDLKPLDGVPGDKLSFVPLQSRNGYRARRGGGSELYYKNKYLKYKQKYLSLKRKLI
jgi:hypothetical protein